MTQDVFISSHPNEMWREVAESLIKYLKVELSESEYGLNEGYTLQLETGDFFRSIGVSNQSIHLIDLICQWCTQTGRHSGLIINDLFESTLGSYKNTQYLIQTAPLNTNKVTL